MSDLWASVADGYDDRYADRGSAAEDKVVGFLVRRALRECRSPAPVLLDLGSGTGNLVESVPPGAQYFGIEPSESMLRVAHKRHPEYDFELGSAEAINALDSSIDVCVAAWSLCFADLPRACGEIVRVLKPGGHFLAVWPWQMQEKRPSSTNHAGIAPKPWDVAAETVARQAMPGLQVYGFNPWGEHPPRLGPLTAPLMLLDMWLNSDDPRPPVLSGHGAIHSAGARRVVRPACHVVLRWVATDKAEQMKGRSDA